MTTGFLGTRRILPALSASGKHDLAVRLFQSREFPSWGYPVVNGANTVWERWDSYTKEEGFGRHNAAMNSFSHYAFGAVMEWAFGDLAGIRSDGPGYARILIAPGPPSIGLDSKVRPLHWVKAEYDSPRGLIKSAWRVEEDGRFTLEAVIPANTTATVRLPADSAARATEGGRPLAQSEGVKVLRQERGVLVLEVPSGSYRFSSRR
jgi:alpha-L-rhamnosidase